MCEVERAFGVFLFGIAGSVFDLFGNREALDLLTTVESLYIVELMGLGNLKRTSRRSVSFGYDSNLGSSS